MLYKGGAMLFFSRLKDNLCDWWNIRALNMKQRNQVSAALIIADLNIKKICLSK